MKKVTIIDYGAGNIKSIINAFEFQDILAETTNDRKIIRQATHLVLPGVGAFPNSMKLLKDKNIIDDLKEHCFKKKPFLGICLGMQMMFDYSTEIQKTNGLGLIEGKVEKLPENQITNSNFKIPNIGWYDLSINTKTNDKFFELKASSFYFVHSFHCIPKNNDVILYYSNFNQYKFCAAVAYENLVGFQFHPEKSRSQGLNLMKNFTRM